MNVWKIDIREVVNDPTWQALREGLVGTWKYTPCANVLVLQNYLQEARQSGDKTEYALRVRRVLNYVTGSGFRTGQLAHPQIDRLYEHVRAEATRMKQAA